MSVSRGYPARPLCCQHTETVRLLGAMLCAVVFGEGRGALEAEVCGSERGDDLAVDGLGSLGDEGGRVEDASEDRPVMLDRRIRRRLVLVKESLEVFCNCQRGWFRVGERHGLPQPYMGCPGWGPFTLWFLGDAGVAGLATILRVLVPRVGKSEERGDGEGWTACAGCGADASRDGLNCKCFKVLRSGRIARCPRTGG